METIKIRGCTVKRVNELIRFINASLRHCQFEGEQQIDKYILRDTEYLTKDIISKYDIKYCKTIIKIHANDNIYAAIMKSKSGKFDMSNELNFYKQLIFPYVFDIVYNNMKIAYYTTYPVGKNEDCECSICLDNIQLSKKYTTKCKHTFHIGCYMNWIASGGKCCPNCRNAFN